MKNLLVTLCGFLGGFVPLTVAAVEPFAIRVVDEATGRGVPLVELMTVNHVTCVTDSAGDVAFDDESLMNERVFFHVRSHGYEFPAGPFGYRAVTLDVTPGGEAELKIRRINIAERLYRVTGAGIYRDSVRLGRPAPLKHPLLNAGVLGSDSVVNAVFRGRIYWFWGDTNLPQHQLGIFHVPGATSALPREGGLIPGSGVDLDYFLDDKGQAKSTCRMPGDGPTWIDGLSVLNDGGERLFAHYVKVRPPLDVYAGGICEFDPAAEEFRHVLDLDPQHPLHPAGHPLHITTDGVEYLYFASPFPYARVPATVEAFLDTSQYEAYTCVMPGGDSEPQQVIRGDDGKPQFAWRRGGLPLNHTRAKQLVEEKRLAPEDLVFRLRDRDTGRPVQAHGGSLYWNEYRQRWVMIALETWGSSLLGEIWFAEAATPLGPWGDAVKIVTHDDYSFYNPKQHPMLDEENGRIIYFEGTYTHTFSGNKNPTPRYDYNQIMYRLDLSDPRLGLSAPE
ncbi:MAG: hypothetical protein KF861_20565 [Planctomycetaceae bacterium]|nr:hypothetical protein [Planctomycetaceae bacterium]